MPGMRWIAPAADWSGNAPMSVAVTESTTVEAFFLICCAVSSARRTPMMTISSFFAGAEALGLMVEEDACCVCDCGSAGVGAAGFSAAATALAPHSAMTETPARKNAQLAPCDRLPLIRLAPQSPPAQ